MPEDTVSLPPNRVNDEFLSQPEKLEDSSVSALVDAGLLHACWSQEYVDLLLAKRVRDAVTVLQGFGRGFPDRAVSQRMLEILKSVATSSHAFVEGHQPREDCLLSIADFGALLRPQSKKRFEATQVFEAALNKAETALGDSARISFRQCIDTIRSGFQWEPRQRALVLEPAREYLGEALQDPDASDMGELWLLDGMLGLWLKDDPMSVERSFERGINCRTSTDNFILSMLHRLKAFAAAQDGRYTQAFEGAQEAIKLHEDWATYLELAHYSLPIDNQQEALSAIRSAIRLFPLSIAIIVASDALANIWTSVDANFLRYIDDFRSHSITELKSWEVAYGRARNVIAAGINFDMPTDIIPDADKVRYQLDQEKGLRLLSMPTLIRASHERLTSALSQHVTSQLSHRYEELRAVKADAKLAEAARKVALAEAEREVKHSQEAVKTVDNSTKFCTRQSLTACASLFGMSMLLFVAFSVLTVILKEGIFTQYPNLVTICYCLSVIPALIGMGYHMSVVFRNNLVKQANKQRMRRWQRDYDAKVGKIEEANRDRASYHEKRVAAAEARYRCAQEAERAFRGETFTRKGADHDDLNYKSAA